MIKRSLKKHPTEKAVDNVRPEESVLDKLEGFAGEKKLMAFTNKNVEESYLILPPLLSDLESKELGNYFHTFTQQKIWARTLFAQVNALLTETNDKLDERRSVIFKELPQKISMAEKELSLLRDELAKPLVEESRLLKAKVKMLFSYMENLDDGIFSISREITRRQGDFNDENRGNNINNMRRR